MPHPEPLGADDVEDPGLVLEAEEGDVPGGRRALAVSDHPGDPDPGGVLHLTQAGDREHPVGRQLLPQQRHRMVIQGDAGGPGIRGGELGIAHPRQHRRLCADREMRQGAWGLLGGGTRRPQRLPA